MPSTATLVGVGGDFHQVNSGQYTGYFRIELPTSVEDDVAILFLAGGGFAAVPSLVSSGWTTIQSLMIPVTGAQVNTQFALVAYYRRMTSSPDTEVIINYNNISDATLIMLRGLRKSASPVRTVLTNGQVISPANRYIRNTVNSAVNYSGGSLLFATFAEFIYASSDGFVREMAGDYGAPVSESALIESDYGSSGYKMSLGYSLDVPDLLSSIKGKFTLIDGFTNPNSFNNFQAAGMTLFLIDEINRSAFSSVGTSTAQFGGTGIKPSSFSSAGVATVSNPGAYKFRSAFAAAGVATAEMVGHALVRSPFNAAGVATAQMVGAGNNASSFSSIGSSSANMIGNSTATSSFNSEGTSLAVMFSPSVVASAFNSTGTSTAAMFSPTITITTLIDGSGGAGLATVIDYSLCDFAQVILSAGVGTYSIEHVNLIPGKWITVTLVNQGASGSLIWNNGDAPVDWSPALAPDFPANGETLDLEFFVRRDRSVIRGRRAFA